MIRILNQPPPSSRALRSAVAALGRAGLRRARPYDMTARDPHFIEQLRPLLDLLYDAYFRCETELEEEIPEGPLLVVANHNGMTGVPDMFCIMTAYWRRYGSSELAYGLMHDVPFHVPFAGAWLNAAGALAASPANGMAALSRGAKVLVFPGGDIDACKPYRKRYQIEFAGRRGFLRLALRAQVRILPVVSVGAHQSLYLFTDGQRIARTLRLNRLLRTNVFPVGFALPYGLILGTPFPHLPPPVKIHTRICAPLDLGLPASAADDPDALDHCYARVVATMQQAMDDLRRAGRHGLFPESAVL